MQHILEVGLLHYDPDVRILAAASLEKIVRLDSNGLASELIGRQVRGILRSTV